METLIAFLNSLHPLSQALIEHLLKTVKSKTISKNEIILRPPQINRDIVFIAKGILRAYYVKDGEEVNSWFMKEGDVIVSITSFYNQVPTFEYIQALEECTIFYISFEELNFIYTSYIEFNVVGRILLQKYLILWDEVLHGLRQNTVKERYLWLLENHSELITRVPQKHIASWLGISRFNMSRIKSTIYHPIKEISKKEKTVTG